MWVILPSKEFHGADLSVERQALAKGSRVESDHPRVMCACTSARRRVRKTPLGLRRHQVQGAEIFRRFVPSTQLPEQSARGPHEMVAV